MYLIFIWDKNQVSSSDLLFLEVSETDFQSFQRRMYCGL